MKIVNAVLCEDVRQEIGNKRSLMGVFSGDIRAAAMPAHVQLALYVDFEIADPANESSLDVAFFVNDEKVVNFQAKLSPGSKHATLVVPKGIVQFDKDSVFTIRIAPDNQKEEEVVRKLVTGPAMAERVTLPTDSPPPS